MPRAKANPESEEMSVETPEGVTVVESTENPKVIKKYKPSKLNKHINKYSVGYTDQFGEITAAITRAQKNFKVSDLTKSQSGYQNRYAFEDFTSVLNIVREPLHNEGVNFSQHPELRRNEKGEIVEGKLTTVFTHTSNQMFWSSTLFVFDTSGQKNLQQSAGSAITYMKRYTLNALLGLSASKDDDGQSSGEPVNYNNNNRANNSGGQNRNYNNNNNNNRGNQQNNNQNRSNNNQELSTRPVSQSGNQVPSASPEVAQQLEAELKNISSAAESDAFLKKLQAALNNKTVDQKSYALIKGQLNEISARFPVEQTA